MIANFILKALVIALSIGNVHSLAIPDASANPAAEPLNILIKRNAHCGDSTFVGKTSSTSPRATDCSKLANRMRASQETFLLGYRVTEGTCAFVASTKNIFTTYIGNDDVADLLYDSVIKFKSNNVVAAEGDMGCNNSNGGLSKVLWAIQHS